ncbi:hypothetical protein [Allocoleopsis sp.]
MVPSQQSGTKFSTAPQAIASQSLQSGWDRFRMFAQLLEMQLIPISS